jgi:phosphoglucosamine mutase
MARKFFGTDGVRGTAINTMMTARNGLKISAAAGRYSCDGSKRPPRRDR